MRLSGQRGKGLRTKRLRVILLNFDNDGERHMKIIKIIAAAASLLILAAVPASAQTAEAALKSADGKDVGAVELTQTPTGVLLKASVKGLPPGEQAFLSMRSGNAILPSIPQAAISIRTARNMASWRLRATMPATCRIFTFHRAASSWSKC